jgi:hypothetical protein
MFARIVSPDGFDVREYKRLNGTRTIRRVIYSYDSKYIGRTDQQVRRTSKSIPPTKANEEIRLLQGQGWILATYVI